MFQIEQTKSQHLLLFIIFSWNEYREFWSRYNIVYLFIIILPYLIFNLFPMCRQFLGIKIYNKLYIPCL